MAGNCAKLSQRQELAISALLTEPSLLDAAQRARIGERTLRRWLHEPQYQAFQEVYRAAKRDGVAHATTLLQQAAATAVETLLAVMKDPEAPASARVAAAKAVLEQAFRGVEIEELESRIATLEVQQRERST